MNSLSYISMYHCDSLFLMFRQKADWSPGASQFINYNSAKISLYQTSFWFLAVKLTLPGWTVFLKTLKEQLCTASPCGLRHLAGDGSRHGGWKHTPERWLHFPASSLQWFVHSLSLDFNCTECLLVYTCQPGSAPLWALECQWQLRAVRQPRLTRALSSYPGINTGARTCITCRLDAPN